MPKVNSRILLIEDDLVIATNLKEDLEEIGYTVVGIANDQESADTLFDRERVNLIIADINLEKSSPEDGIKLTKRLVARRWVPVVFLSAHRDGNYRERARGLQPVAYLLKPVKPHQLDIFLDYALDKTRRPTAGQGVQITGRRVFVRRGGRYVGVDIGEICYLHADGSSCMLFTDTERFFVNETLQKMVKRLEGPPIFRVHRSYAVNRYRIHSFDASNFYVYRDCELVKVPYTNRYSEEIMRAINKI